MRKGHPSGVPSLERIQPNFVIVDQHMRLFNLFLRHLLDDFFLADRSIRVAPDCAQHIPHIGPHQIGRGQATPRLIVPANPGLRPRMPFHRRAKIPFKRPLVVLFDAKPKRIHDPDQFLSIRIAGTRRLPQFLAGFFKTPGLHQVFRAANFRHSRSRKKTSNNNKFQHFTLQVSAAVCLSFAAISSAAQTPPLEEKHFLPYNAKGAEVGRLLFYDPILSGNRNISCGTCHHHDLGTGDGLSLGIGEGGTGLGPERVSGTGRHAVERRIPRNAPPLWNLGAKELRVFFHDGRLSKSNIFGNDFNSPADKALPDNIPNIMAAQALFPMTAEAEMAGDLEDNEIARAARRRPQEAWALLAKRVRSIPEYAAMLRAANLEIEDASEIEIHHIASALGDFINSEWRSHDSPYDRHLRGEAQLAEQELRGLDLFFGEANCSSCHRGRLLTDQKFHALALPPIGPGRTRAFDAMVRDRGRLNETNRIEDAYRFRTPMLRNVALTAPYGHNGAYRTLEGIIRHHLDPAEALANWTPERALLPDIPWLASVDFIGQKDAREMARLAKAIDIESKNLTDSEIADLVAFLQTLTGGDSTKGRLGRPETVPSGLKVD